MKKFFGWSAHALRKAASASTVMSAKNFRRVIQITKSFCGTALECMRVLEATRLRRASEG